MSSELIFEQLAAIKANTMGKKKYDLTKNSFFIQFNTNVLLPNKDTFPELIKKDTLNVFFVIKKGPFKGPFFMQLSIIK